MENACMKTLPNTKPLWPRWRMPWSLPCPIKSSPRNRSRSPLCGSNRPHSRSPKPCPPGPRGPPGTPWSQRIPKQHQQRPPTVTNAQATQGRSNDRPTRQTNYRPPQLPTVNNSIPPPTVRPNQCSSRPENLQASEPSLTKMAESNNMDIPSTPADEAGCFPTSSSCK